MTRATRFWLALGTVYVVWGSTYLGIALAGETIPPVFAAGIRFAAAGALMGVWVLVSRGSGAFRLTRPELLSVAAVGVTLTGGNALLFVAERDVPTSLAALVFASVPLWIVVLRTLGGDRPAAGSLVGTAVGFAGVALLLRPGGEAGATGLALVVAATLAWATGSFAASRLPLPRDAQVLVTLEMLAGAAVLVPLGILLRGGESLDPATWSARSLLGLAYLVVFGSLVGFTAYVWLIANAPIGRVATYAYVNPVVAVALGTAILDEQPTWALAAGALVVLVAVAVVVRRETGPAAPG